MAIAELQLTQQEANKLIIEIKVLARKVDGTISNGSKGTIDVVSKIDNRKFKISYFYRRNNIHINFYDVKTGLSLVRLNLNQSFHRNADGTKIVGNRVNIFSEQEYALKNDGKTHMRAFPLPHGALKNTSDFLESLTNLFDYTNTEYKNKFSLMLDTTLNV